MTAKKDKKNKNEHTENARILIIDYIFLLIYIFLS